MAEKKAPLFKSILCTSLSHNYCYQEACNCACHQTYTTRSGENAVAALAYELVFAGHAAPTYSRLRDVSTKALKVLGHSFTADEVGSFIGALTIAQGKDYWSMNEFNEDFARLRAEAATQSDTLF